MDTLYGVGIPATVTKLGNGCFSGCHLSEVSIPESVKSLGYGVFSNNNSLSRITFLGNPDVLMDGCLGDTKKEVYVYHSAAKVISFCTARSSYLTLKYMKTDAEIALEKENAAVPVTFTYQDKYGSWTFNRSTGTITNYNGTVQKAAVPETITCNGYRYNVKTLGIHAIHDNKTLTELEINTPYIDTEAVYNCSNLAKIYLGYSVNFLGPYCFWSNNNLKYLSVSSNPVTASSIIQPKEDMYVLCNFLSLYMRYYCYTYHIKDSNDDIHMDLSQQCSFRDTMINAADGLSNTKYFLDSLKGSGFISGNYTKLSDQLDSSWKTWVNSLPKDQYFAVTGERRKFTGK
jgi:Leucine-rich repeat (LRR) protein